MTETPLHVRVAEALGFTDPECETSGDAWRAFPPNEYRLGVGRVAPIPGHKHLIPHFDTDWSATGPLIEQYKISLRSPNEPESCGANWWEAETWKWGDPQSGVSIKGARSALTAVCNLILALHAAGKLKAA